METVKSFACCMLECCIMKMILPMIVLLYLSQPLAISFLSADLSFCSLSTVTWRPSFVSISSSFFIPSSSGFSFPAAHVAVSVHLSFHFSISLYIPFSPLLAPAPLTLECIKVKNDCFILSDLIINDDSCFELTLASSTSIPFSYQMIPLTYLMFINRACIFDFRIDAAWKFDKIQLILFKRPEYLKLTLKVSYKNGDNQILGFLLHEGNESSGTNEP